MLTLQSSDIYIPAVKHHETWLKTDLMDFGAGDMGFIWENDPVKRREVARKVLPAFSSRATRAKEPIIHKYINLFIEKMKLRGNTPGGIELGKVYGSNLSGPLDMHVSRTHNSRHSGCSGFLSICLRTSRIVAKCIISETVRAQSD